MEEKGTGTQAGTLGASHRSLFVPRSAGRTVPGAQLSVWASLALPQTRVPGRESNSDGTPSSGGSDRCSAGYLGSEPHGRLCSRWLPAGNTGPLSTVPTLAAGGLLVCTDLGLAAALRPQSFNSVAALCPLSWLQRSPFPG